ncbi:MAG TPA: M20/M25/M40 family metallo-hydrolase [Terriglobales bacterium]|jgi:aminopeptidase YwaD|nr:M20/M25/M40 family metallo-hydrolase [Terriglobales bacterium]
MKRLPLLAFGLLLILISRSAGSQAQPSATEADKPKTVPRHAGAAVPAPSVCSACIRAHMEFLASDALRGRGSGTADEMVAATYVASQLRAYGIAPAGDDGGYIQRAVFEQPRLTAPPQLTFVKPSANAAGEQISWTFGKEFIVRSLSQTHFSGRLRVINADEYDPGVAGSVVLILGSDWPKLRAKAVSVTSAGAVAAVVTATAEHAARFEEKARQLPDLPAKIDGKDAAGLGDSFTLLEINPDAVTLLKALPENTTVTFASSESSEPRHTWNALGMLPGSDPKRGAVLLSAHLDHLGIGKPVNGDNIYNGADDDASGTTAVLELARALGSGPRPKRTVVFALFGSEELGGLGSAYFREHPPLPLQDIAVNLEFEMLGRADPAVKSDTVWLTGWERSNLGPELAARGAKLVGDPHPKSNFFARSDNYVLAKRGMVAQTVSSYGLHSDYHQPSDDLAHIDFKHMDAAIGSLLEPVSWLVDSDFRPEWKEGGRP